MGGEEEDTRVALALARSAIFHHTEKQDNEKFPSVRWGSPTGAGGAPARACGPQAWP